MQLRGGDEKQVQLEINEMKEELRVQKPEQV